MRAALAALLLLGAQDDRNLLKNGGFESVDNGLPAHWRAIAGPDFRDEVKFGVDPQDKRSGESAAHVDVTNPKNLAAAGFLQEIRGADGLVGKTLELTGWMKTQGATYANLWIQCLDDRDRLLATAGVRRYGGLWGTRDWNDVAARLAIPSGTWTVQIRAVVRGPGEAWFDDLRLLEVKEVKVEPPKIDAEERAFRDAVAKGEDLDRYRKWSFERISRALDRGLGTSAWRPGFQKFRAGEWDYQIWIPKSARDGATLPLLVEPGLPSDAGEHKLWVEEIGASDLFVLRTDIFEQLNRDKTWDDLVKKGWEGHRLVAAALEAVVRDACVRLPVDPNRIYLTGRSFTATWGWSFAAQRPDRFAAFAPFSGQPRDCLRLVPNLARGPGVFVVHGERDGFAPAPVTRQAIRRLKDAEADFVYREHPAAGHLEVFHDRGNALDWMVAHRREAYPKRVDLWLPSSGGAWWVEAEIADIGAPAWDKEEGYDAQARVTASIDANRVEAKCENVKRLRVWLNEKLVDFEKPVVIVVNGKTLHDAKVAPSYDVLVERARATGDGGMLFQAKVDLKLEE